MANCTKEKDAPRVWTRYECPPVLICGFNRPDCLKMVVDAVRAAAPRQVFLSLDFPRQDHAEDAAGYESCRKIFESIDWPCEVHRNYSKKNMGCRWRMGSAITWFFEHVEYGIILEDDCVPNQSFFRFCGELLEKYKYDERIAGVCGYIEHWRLVDELKCRDYSYYFDRLNTCWGWATWRRAWQYFDERMHDWPGQFDAGLLRKICRNKREEQILSRMYNAVYSGKKSSWATAWSFSCLKKDLLFLHPTMSLIRNVGSGKDATHCSGKGMRHWEKVASLELKFPLSHPEAIEIDYAIEHRVLLWMYVPGRLKILISRMKRFLLNQISGR